jgi:hypothetical protein
MTTPAEQAAAKAAADKAAADKKSTGTTIQTAKATGTDVKTYLDQVAKMGLGKTSTGTVNPYTPQDADATIQDMYQQLLGRNAMGNEYSRALAVYNSQSAQTGYQGRNQAIENIIQATPEYQARQQNTYLDAIYQDLARKIQEAQR